MKSPCFKWLVFKLFLILVLTSLSIAQEKTFIREYTHKAGDADSKITSRAIALNQVKKILLEEIGVYLESTFEIEKTETSEEYKELTNSQIISITAGITETKIIDEKWNGIEFYIKAEITIDVNDMHYKLNKIAKDRDNTKQLEEANTRAEEAFVELNRIEEKLKETISEKEKLQLQLDYARSSDILSALDWFQKGYNSTELKEYDNAILYYQRALEISPSGFYLIYNNMGYVYSCKGNYDNAIEFYQRAIEINPNNVILYYNLGLTYVNKGFYDKAIESFHKAIEIDPNYPGAYCDMGLVYKLKGNYDKAIELYNKVIEKDPNYAKAYYNMGTAYLKKGNDVKAIEFYQRAIEINPNNDDALNIMGSVYHDKGKYDEAILYYQRAIKINPNNTNAYYNLGLVSQDKGNDVKAIEFYQKAARLGNKGAQDILKTNNISW